MWKLRCHSGPVSRRNRLVSTTGSKDNVTGDKRPQLRAVIVCVPTLSYLSVTNIYKHTHTQTHTNAHTHDKAFFITLQHTLTRNTKVY